MTNQHPITPPPELVARWASSLYGYYTAARWGADQELEACVNYVDNTISGNKARALRAIRRPKPPSLKEQALEQLDGIATCFRATHMGDIVCDKIRRALETLDD